MKLKIAAKVDRADREYFASKIEPLLSSADVEFIGEIGEHQKNDFLGGAAALLFPIAWREPFGLVMIEAMACGTPIIAFRNGSVPEVLQDGVSGFIVDSEQEAVAALGRLNELDRDRIRAEFDQRFTSRHMAQNYLKLYSRLQHAKPARSKVLNGGFLQHAALAAHAVAVPLLPRAEKSATIA
jgi:glycosyltransferase involved in cell wall biosynthesis